MSKISLVGLSLAKKGTVFTYVGRTDECEKCKLVKICQNLEPGKRYIITGIREKEHDCPVHEHQKVVAVEVEEAPTEVSIQSRKAMDGAVVELDKDGCPLKWCKNHYMCRRDLFVKGQKVSVLEIAGSLDCPRGLKLKKAVVKLVE